MGVFIASGAEGLTADKGDLRAEGVNAQLFDGFLGGAEQSVRLLEEEVVKDDREVGIRVYALSHV